METQKNESVEEKKEVVKEEVNLQIHWFLFSFLMIYYFSYLLPGAIFLLYVLVLLVPYVMETPQFLTLFTNIDSLLILISFPFVAILCYLLRLFLIGLITRILWGITEKKSPTKDGIIPRNIHSKTANYYHIRSFMIKYPKYIFTKGLFPWLANWMFNFVKTNKIGKGTTIEEQICADKYIDVGKNCYIGVGSVLTSHLVEGTFGNIVYFQIKLGDNVTFGASNNYACGCKFADNAFLMPWASGGKFYTVSGDNFYEGLPLRKIFKKKIEEYLRIPLNIQEEEKKYRNDPANLRNLQQALKEYNNSRGQTINIGVESKKQEDKPQEKKQTEPSPEQKTEKSDDSSDFALDFTTSSAISKISIKFLILYIPILWFGGLLGSLYWYEFTRNKPFILDDPLNWIGTFIMLPISLLFMYLIFVVGCVFFTKLFLILINLVHKPKEGVFKAEPGNPDFDFWCLRTEIRKIPLFLTRNAPIPYIDSWALRWLGVNMDFSSHLNDAWCDSEFLELGRKVTVGQGAVLLSSMVVGKYLFIKKVIIDDYVVVGGQDTIAPGTYFGKDTVTGALSTTNYGQVLEPGWIYFGIPVIKLKPNKYSEEKRDSIRIIDVDGEKKYNVKQEVNVDEDKKHLVNGGK